MRARVLLTGATGYVGGRLLEELRKIGVQVRCFARSPEPLRARVDEETEVVGGDVFDLESLKHALEGIEVAYYLIHSMGAKRGFEVRDRVAAENFARAARDAGCKRIVYLGGLGDERDDLSPHLRSRQEVGKVLAQSGVPTLEFRASIVLGSGGLSFELVRSLAEHLPIMVLPRWVSVEAQPIPIRELLQYLVGAMYVDLPTSRVVEIGGADRVSYAGLMKEYARQRNLKRVFIPVPILSPGLSSLWLGLVTPLYARVGRKLIDSIRHATVVQDDSAKKLFPEIHPVGYREALRRSLRIEDLEFARTHWSDALSAGGDHGRLPDPETCREGAALGGYGGVRYGHRRLDSREITIDAPPERAFAPIAEIGGENGWYAYSWLWKIRGAIDVLVGGVGLRRGRPQGRGLRVGDALDWWRVSVLDTPEKMLLTAEMKVPGRAWLEFEVEPVEGSNGERSRVRQTAIFDPAGLFGLLYWYAIYPIHGPVFRGMLRGIQTRATDS
ncbi:MAG: SDR family oxidoreductase [Planctomycetota bacterium]